ncbi:NADH dehydrogenase [ubiquinone] 1 alpha subcomplex subunit 8 [Anabrus simplex]|uniref:NADH dehydrogenase [ubiquinone] 1 alpha subcomplex subunit 8 n=1 Tax=Anabrus simplex TaxID=316456 RepID=UPI0034DD11D3
MVVTADISLPPDEDLTVEELNITGAALRAGAFHVGKYCENQNNEFMLCRKELDDPRKCINEGKDVTSCALEFFRKVKSSCYDEFTQYANCLDKSSSLFEFQHCRKTQAVYDKCVLDNVGVERPHYGYFCRAKIHDTNRPKPEEPKPAVYPDATPYLPEDYPRPPAKYGSRFHFLN